MPVGDLGKRSMSQCIDLSCQITCDASSWLAQLHANFCHVELMGSKPNRMRHYLLGGRQMHVVETNPIHWMRNSHGFFPKQQPLDDLVNHASLTGFSYRLPLVLHHSWANTTQCRISKLRCRYLFIGEIPVDSCSYKFMVMALNGVSVMRLHGK